MCTPARGYDAMALTVCEIMPPSNSTAVWLWLECSVFQTQMPTIARCTCRRQTVLWQAQACLQMAKP